MRIGDSQSPAVISPLIVCPTAMGVIEQSGPVPDCLIGIRKPPTSEFVPLAATSTNERRPIELVFAAMVKLKLRDPDVAPVNDGVIQLNPPEVESPMTP